MRPCHKLTLFTFSIGVIPMPNAVVALDPSSSVICTPQACLNGTSSLAAGATVKAETVFKLLPGTYSANANSPSSFAVPVSFPALSSASATPGFTISRSGDSVLVNQSANLISYTDALFSGNPTVSNASTGGLRSFLLAEGLQLRIRDPPLTLYDSCPDVAEWPSSTPHGSLEILSVESVSCPHGCGVGGTCGPAGVCTCSPGFTGSRCDTCSPGYFGRNCQLCPQCSSQTRCEDGITGSGVCGTGNTIGNSRNASAAFQSCNCVNGYCISSFGCLCSAGWVAAPNGTLCAACAPGSYQDPSGNCLPCAPGCLSCASPTGVCDTCLQGLRVSSKDNRNCEQAPFNLFGSINPSGTTQPSQNTQISCADGRYNAKDSSCLPCDSACDTCYGPSSSECLRCKGTRGLLVVGITDKKDGQRGSCVDVDSSTGVCHSLSGLFLYSAIKGMCEPAPRLCKTAGIPGFSFDGSKAPALPACSSCEAGSLILSTAPEGARCVGTCPIGTFDNGQGACTTCPSSCATCRADGEGALCTSCRETSQVLDNGKCVGSCRDGSFPSRMDTDTSFALHGTTTCLPCGSSCATCSGNSTSCLSCPEARPAYDPVTKTCAASCGRGFFVENDGHCTRCDSTCGTCSASGSENCLSCSGGLVLRGGKCISAPCPENREIFAPWGVCLAMLLDSSRQTSQSSRRSLPIWIIIFICLVSAVLILAGALIFWRWRAVKKREDRTTKFGNGFYTRATDIKLKQLGLRPSSGATETGPHLWGAGWARSERLSQTPNQRPLSTFSATSEVLCSAASSSFKIKRKEVPSLLPPATDRGSIYSQPDERIDIRTFSPSPMKSEAGSVWFEPGVRPARKDGDHLDLDPNYQGPY